MKEFIKALVSKNKSNIVPAEHNLFGHFVGEWDFEWIDCYGTAEERHIKGEWIFQWILEGTATQPNTWITRPLDTEAAQYSAAFSMLGPSWSNCRSNCSLMTLWYS